MEIADQWRRSAILMMRYTHCQRAGYNVVTSRRRKKLRTETAQRILWFAVIFIVLMVIATVIGAIALTALMTFIDIGSFITDPTILAFLAEYPYAPAIVLWVLVVVEVIYLAIVYMWRKNPMAHRTGLTILGIIQLIAGFNLVGLLLLLPGLLLESEQ
jgi:hypothetical protein